MITRLGPCGGGGGGARDMAPDAVRRITKLIIRYGHAIDAFAFAYELNDGSQHQTPLWGGRGGCNPLEIYLAETEYITSISGYVDKFAGTHVVRSIKFETNIRNGAGGIGPFGLETGKLFTLGAINGKIVGFFANSGTLLDAIGIYVQT